MRLGRIGLEKRLRIGFLVVLVLLLAAFLYNLYRVYREPSVGKKNLPVYSYNHRAQIDYQVQIRPNNIFNDTKMGPGQTYYTKLVKSIDAVCTYHYTASASAEMKAVYRIIAAVEAPEMWRKEFILVPESVVQTTGKTLSFNRPFTINLETYNQFLKSVNEQLGVSAREPRLVIRADIAVEANAAAGKVSEKLTPAMVIPLTSGEFQIGGTPSPQKNGALTRTVLVTDPGARNKRAKAAVPTVLIFILLAIFPLATVNRKSVRPTAAEVFWKQHGERVVRAGDDFRLPGDLIMVSLSSLDDLIKAADEAGKPVIYQEAAPPQNPVCFVIDGLTVYRCKITDSYRDLDAASQALQNRSPYSAEAAGSLRNQGLTDA